MNIQITQKQIDAYNEHIANDHTSPNVNISVQDFAQSIIDNAFSKFIKEKKEKDLDSKKDIIDDLLKASPAKLQEIKDILKK
jgi:hypothetical protein